MNRQQRRAWGPVVLALRTSRAITQDELALAADTTRQTIGAIENGRSAGQEAVLRRMLAVLGLDPDRQTPAEIVQRVQAVLPQLAHEDRAPAIVATVSLFMGDGDFPEDIAQSAFDAFAQSGYEGQDSSERGAV